MTKILITGGSGFIGTNLVQHFMDRGAHVLNLDIRSPRNNLHEQVWQRTNILELAPLQESICGFAPDFVIHMAARTDLYGKRVEDYAENTTGVSNVIQALSGISSLKRVIFTSSMLVCKLGYRPKDEEDCCPTTAYGQSKSLGERLVREQRKDLFPWVIVRPTSIWGPWFGAPYRNFFDAVRRGLYVHPRGLKVWRSYGYVGNTVFQISNLMSCAGGLVHGRTFYLADYEPLELRPWAELVRDAFHAHPVYDGPIFLFNVAAKVGDTLGKVGIRFPLTSFRLNNMMTNATFELDSLRSICGALPFEAAEAVQLTAEWMKQHG